MLFSSAIGKASFNSFAINNYTNSIDFVADNDTSCVCQTAKHLLSGRGKVEKIKPSKDLAGYLPV